MTFPEILMRGAFGIALSLASIAATSLPTAAKRPFTGAITLAVDVTDTHRGIVTAHETIPVQAVGDVVLLYPQWETGSHAPTVPLASLAGLVIRVDGQRVEWRRDPTDLYAFHIPVRPGAREIEVDLQHIADRGAMRDDLLNVQWQRVLLYPAGWAASALPVGASLHVPKDLHLVTALDTTSAGEGVAHFVQTSLDRLIDAPVYAARHVRRLDLTRSGPPVRLDLMVGDPANLAIDDAELGRLRSLVAQTYRVFGVPPFRHYDAIVFLDDGVGAGGIEHLEEGENTLPAAYFLHPERQLNNRDLIAHELVHAWNGRYRQPADLWTPGFNQPAAGSLLWVYEGQTEFWGRVLAARSGLRSPQETLHKLATDAALVANRPGRAWKSLQDSTNDAAYMAGHHVAWRDWQRREDYYPEGVLLWLDVDARLRELTGGARGLDAFAARFFRVVGPVGAVSTYTFDDVSAALDGIAHDDWRGFLRRHLDTHDTADAMAGLARSGWRLVYTDQPSETFRQDERENEAIDLTYSIGAVIGEDGRVASVAWGGPAFQAGLIAGARVTAVAGKPFARDELLRAVAATPRVALTLTVDGKPVTIAYRGGLRYPRLERLPGRPDRLSMLLAPRT